MGSCNGARQARPVGSGIMRPALRFRAVSPNQVFPVLGVMGARKAYYGH